MKTISLWQPWASAIALGLKRIETRGWATKYRGPLAIHAALIRDESGRDCFSRYREAFAEKGQINFVKLPFGAIVATCRLADCVPVERIRMNLSERELGLGGYDAGRFAWLLEDVKALPQPIPFKGRQGFFDCPLVD